jgi:hypothetical protein
MVRHISTGQKMKKELKATSVSLKVIGVSGKLLYIITNKGANKRKEIRYVSPTHQVQFRVKLLNVM